jgi:quercetin dioxygenase-like cupin family protein
MRTFRFGPEASRHVDRHGSDFRLSRLAHAEGIHVGCLYLGPSGLVGYHPATTYQLFAVVEGNGWVRADGSERIPIRAGQAALWAPGERHEAGTDVGMTALVLFFLSERRAERSVMSSQSVSWVRGASTA